MGWSEIRDRVDLARVAEGLLGPPAMRNARRLLWSCPFHDDRHPSFQVDVHRNAWRCWPCGLGGDAPALVMRVERVPFPEAARRAAELAGVPWPSRWEPARGPRRRDETPPSPPAPGGLSREEALDLVARGVAGLEGPGGAGARAYLRRRGLSDATVEAARLGWCPGVRLPSRDGLRAFRASGIVIPWLDDDGTPRLVKLRQPEGKRPKYVEAFRDGPGLFPGARAIRPGRPAIVVEGEFDALLLGQELGERAGVVTLGPAGGEPRATALWPLLLARPRFLALDADEAGDKAAGRWPPPLIRVRPPSPSKDWTELWQSEPAALGAFWTRLLDEAEAYGR